MATGSKNQLFKPVDVEFELKHNRSIEQNLLDEAHLLLQESALHGGSRFNAFKAIASQSIIDVNTLQQKDKENTFSLREIKQFCVNYHMRFLQQKKSEIEIEKKYILKIYAFEEQYNVRITEFFVLVSETLYGAASENPSVVVFGKLSANSYYYFGTFGKELNTKRKILFFPFRSIYSFAVYNLIPSLIFAFVLPTDWLQTTIEVEINLRLWLAVHLYIALFSFSIFIGALCNVRFSEMEWENEFKKQKPH